MAPTPAGNGWMVVFTCCLQGCGMNSCKAKWLFSIPRKVKVWIFGFPGGLIPWQESHRKYEPLGKGAGTRVSVVITVTNESAWNFNLDWGGEMRNTQKEMNYLFPHWGPENVEWVLILFEQEPVDQVWGRLCKIWPYLLLARHLGSQWIIQIGPLSRCSEECEILPSMESGE